MATTQISKQQFKAITTKGDLLAFDTAVTRLPVGSDGQILSADSTQATGLKWIAAGGGTGTVTSVAMTVPGFLSVAGSPVTTSGTLAVTLATQSANLVFAGPTTGGAATPTFRSLVAADMPAGAMSPLSAKGDLYTFSTVDAALPVGSNGQVLSADSTQTTGLKWIAAGGTGTVTSVALTVPTGFSVSGSPVTTSGTLAITLSNENANTVWAGPTSGGAAAPVFRNLVAADMPAGFTTGGVVFIYGNAAASGAIGASSSAENDFNKTFTFNSNTLTVGDIYRITIGITGNSGTSAQNHTLRVYLGTNTIYVPLNVLAPSGTGAFAGFATVLFTVRTTGNTGTVDATGEWMITRSGSSQIPQADSVGIATVVDTTANAICKVSYQFSGTSPSSNVTLRQFTIEKFGTGT